MLNILVTGSNGQLGKCIKDTLNELSKISNGVRNNYIFKSHNELDITSLRHLSHFFYEQQEKGENIDVVINCAAYTNVDKAEEDYIKAYDINEQGVIYLKGCCDAYNSFLITIGTDYIYEGNNSKPICEDIYDYISRYNGCRPINMYGETKLAGMRALLTDKPLIGYRGHGTLSRIDNKDNFMIIVVSWLYSKYNGFVKKIYDKLSSMDENNLINVVEDETGSPTYAMDVARFIVKLVEEEIYNKCETKVINFTNDGTASRYDLAKAIKEYGNFKCKINPISSSSLDSVARRPSYTVLSTSLLKSLYPDFKVKYWRDAVKECIEEIKKDKYS